MVEFLFVMLFISLAFEIFIWEAMSTRMKKLERSLEDLRVDAHIEMNSLHESSEVDDE